MAAGFTIFSSSPLPLNFVALQRRLAFLLAMESSRCPSKVASLQCSIYGYPCRLCPLPPVSTKQDGSPWSSGLAHSGPAFSGGVVSLCPVASLEDFLEFWCSHGVRHDFLSSPFSPLSTAAFSELLRWAFRRANINAPGSTRHISVSDTLARGANVSDCLAAGDWTGVQTFFRHYLQPSSSV